MATSRTHSGGNTSDPLCFCFQATRCLLVVLFLFFSCRSQAQSDSNTFIISSVHYPEIQLRPYNWQYLRVDLPAGFSSISLDTKTNVNLGIEKLRNLPIGELPLICFQNGRPPLPDARLSDLDPKVFDVFNGADIGIHANKSINCFFLQENMAVILTNEQVSPGALYFGFFHGIGPMRTQSKMINRGPTYSFSANATVSGCKSPSLGGPFCNQTLDVISCSLTNRNRHVRGLLDLKLQEDNLLKSSEIRQSDYLLENRNLLYKSSLYEQQVQVFPYRENIPSSYMLETGENWVTCKDVKNLECFGIDDVKVYSLDLTGTTVQMKLSIKNASSDSSLQNMTYSSTGSMKDAGIQIKCLARHDAIPSRILYDYDVDLNLFPLTIDFPKHGKWYISIYVANRTNLNGSSSYPACFSLEWKVYGCPEAKGGEGCMWESYLLQRVVKGGFMPWESYYVPAEQYSLKGSSKFPLVPLLSNSSTLQNTSSAWTYFLIDVPDVRANIHVNIRSEAEISHEIYVRLGGFPSTDLWDFRSNGSIYSKSDMFLTPKGSLIEERGNFYILYATEGTWYFGLRESANGHHSEQQITMSVTLEACPNGCNNHGTCRSNWEASGLVAYSYCGCDRTHGGFDCSNELVSYKEHTRQSIFLIVSNAASLLPAFWSLHKKAFSEWILFTLSGISSALYHACDVDTWCSLQYHVLQFLDFWLSFMAVVSTFIYMTKLNETSKRALQMIVSILTALLAETGPTRASNIIIVLAIGALGLLIGWMVEVSSSCRTAHCCSHFNLNFLVQWGNLKQRLFGVLQTLRERFRWLFLFAGFFLLSMAAMCWTLESNQSYWIFHSLWHVTIYTASFFFLCSVSVNRVTSNEDNNAPTENHAERDYQLVSRNSTSAAAERTEEV